MHLSRHLAQGRLLYFTQHQDAICVMENSHFRWLQFHDVVQSIMHKRCPSRLVLPHQVAIMLPLVYFSPKSIVELGLGGGNTLRFIEQLSPHIALTSVENNAEVIALYHRFFANKDSRTKLVQSTANHWLQKNKACDWLICDIYSSLSEPNALLNDEWHSAIAQSSCFTLNLPDASSEEINAILRQLANRYPAKQVYYFDVPHYQNTVIHLIARGLEEPSLLPSYKRKRWQKLWQQAQQVQQVQQTHAIRNEKRVIPTT